MKNIPYLCRCMRQGIYFTEHYAIGNSFDRNLCNVEVIDMVDGIGILPR